MWPFNKPVESRANYTDSITNAILAAASSATATADGTAALESAAGLLSRGFASAEVTGAPGLPITPEFLGRVGRELIWPGESVFLIDVGGAVRLHPVGSYEIRGGYDPDSWIYEVQLEGPSRSARLVRPASAILHFRFSADARRPGRGVGPLGRARISARLLGEIETALADEVSGTRGVLMPTPLDGQDVTLTKLRSTVAGLRGKTAIVETMRGNWGSDRADAPAADWKTIRLGANPPAGMVSLSSNAAVAILAACGTPAALMVAGSAGTAAREALRRWLHTTLHPLARAVQTELRAGLNAPELSLNFDGLFASDLSGRARAFGSLVKGGMATDRAAALAGLLQDDES